MIDHYLLNGIFGVCMFTRFDMEREEAGSPARLGTLSPRTPGEAPQSVRAPRGTVTPALPFRPLPQPPYIPPSPVQQGPAKVSNYGQELMTKNTVSFLPHPLALAVVTEVSWPDTGSNSDCTTSGTCDLEQVI